MSWVERPAVSGRIDDWWHDADAARLLVVVGRFGTGKSVVLAHAAETLAGQPGALVIPHLRLRGADRVLASSDAGGFVDDVGAMLRSQLGQPFRRTATAGGTQVVQNIYADRIESVQRPTGDDPISFAAGRWSSEVSPALRQAVDEGLFPVLVVDALDELDDILIGALTDRMIPELPIGVRMVVSGRPDLPGALLAPGGAIPALIDLDLPSVAADKDIARYTAGRVRDHSDVSGVRIEQLVEQVVANADGKFLYARWVLDDLLANPSIDLDTWAPPDGMGRLYDEFVARVQRRAGKWWPELADVLGSVAASLDPGLTVGQVAQLHGVEVPVLRRWLGDWCGHYVEVDANDRMRVAHASLATHWLNGDRTGLGPLGVAAGDAHARLARWCAEHIGDRSESNHPSPGAVVAQTADSLAVPDYAVRNAVAHAVSAMSAGRDEQQRRAQWASVAHLVMSWSWCAQRHGLHGLGALVGDLDRLCATGRASIRPPPSDVADIEVVSRTLAGARGRFAGLTEEHRFLRQMQCELGRNGQRSLADRIGRELEHDVHPWFCLRWTTADPDDSVEQTFVHHTTDVEALSTTAANRIISSTSTEVVAFDGSASGRDGYDELWRGYSVTPVIAALPGERVAIGVGCDDDSQLIIRDVQGVGEVSFTTGWLTSLAWSGEVIVALTVAGDFRAWNLDDDWGLLPAGRVTGPFSALAVDGQGHVALALTREQRAFVEIWPRATDDVPAVSKPFDTLGGARKITAMAWLSGDRLAVGWSDGSLVVRSVRATNDDDWVGSDPDRGEIKAIAGLSDGSVVSLARQQSSSWSQLRSSVIWRKGPSGDLEQVGELPRTVTALGTTSDGRLVTGHETGEVVTWSDVSRSSRSALQFHPPAWDVAALDHRTVVTGHEDGKLRTWDVGRGELKQVMTGTTGGRITHVAARAGRSICFEEDMGSMTVLGRRGRQWEEQDGHDTEPFMATALSVLPGGRLVVGGGDDVYVTRSRRWKRWRSLKAPVESDLPKVTATCAVSKRRVATGHEDGSVRIWSTNHSVGLVTTHWATPQHERVWSLCAFRNGLVVSSHVDGSLVIWHPGSEVVCLEADPISVVSAIDEEHFVVGNSDGLDLLNRAGDWVAGIHTVPVTGLVSTAAGLVACHEDGGLSSFSIERASTGGRRSRTHSS